MTRPTALVTGATRGIGRVIALDLAKRGFAVVVTGRTLREGEGNLGTAQRPEFVPGSIESTVAEIEAAGGEAFGVRLDLLDRPSMDAAIQATLDRYGRLDLLVNNAIYQGPEVMLPLAQFSMEAAQDSFNGTVINQVYLSRLAIAAMARQGGGRIIYVTSLSTQAKPNGVAGFLYTGAKAAFNHIPAFVHFEHAKDGILAFLVEPRFTVTDTMRARWGDALDEIGGGTKAYEPEETARTISWLALSPDAARFAGGTMLNAPEFFAINGIEPLD